MKILALCNLRPQKVGAFESLIAALGRHAHGQQSSLHVAFAAEPIPEVQAMLREAHVSWSIIPGWSSEWETHPWAVVRPALHLLSEHRPDVVAVHFGNELPTLALILRARLSGLRPKWVWHQRQQIDPPTSLIKAHASKIRILASVCDHFVALYQGGREALIQRHIPASHISVIYNGVPPFTPTHPKGWLRKELGLAEDTTISVNVSGLIRRKRVDLSLRSFAEATQRLDSPKSAHLVVVGTGTELGALHSLATDLGIEDQTHFLGLRNDVRDILYEADLLLLSSTAEACPLAVVEASSCSLPCVLTEAGAASELVHNGETGYVVGRDDAQGFTTALHRLLTNDALRARMAVAMFKNWSERFALDRAVSEHLSLYKHLAKQYERDTDFTTKHTKDTKNGV